MVIVIYVLVIAEVSVCSIHEQVSVCAIHDLHVQEYCVSCTLVILAAAEVLRSKSLLLFGNSWYLILFTISFLEFEALAGRRGNDLRQGQHVHSRYVELHASCCLIE